MNEGYREIEIDLGGIFRVLRHRARILALVAVICAALGFLACRLWLTPRYTSSVTFYVSGNVASPVDSAIVVLETRQTLREVITASGVSCPVEELQKSIRAESVRATDFLEVEVTSHDVVEAKLLADSVAKVLPRRMGEILGDVTAAVVDEAVFAKESSTPGGKQCAVLGAVMGLILSVCAVVLMEIFSPKNAAEKTNL